MTFTPFQVLIAMFLTAVVAWGFLFVALLIVWSHVIGGAAARFEEILRAQQARGKEQLEAIRQVVGILEGGAIEWGAERRVLAAQRQLQIRGT